MRWVCDFRKLNDVTVKDSFPLPLIEDNLFRLGKSTIFSTLDCSQAFHTIPIRAEDREKTAFGTPYGHYEFLKLPFGLSNAPASYSRLVTEVLRHIPLTQALPYLDDVLVHSSTMERHFVNLDLTLQSHRAAGLKLKVSKCNLFASKVLYLGHLVTAQGISVNPDYIKVIKDWPFPNNKNQLRIFVGKASYYRRYVKDFSKIIAPLINAQTALPTEKSPLIKTTELESIFERMKQALVSAPILAFPDFSDTAGRFIVDTDWSGEHNTIGGVLSQEQSEGPPRVIAYGAKKLEESRRRYSPHKGELCAVVYFLKYWSHFLQYKKFLLRTDHASLRYIKTMEKPTGMILRWLDCLANYTFDVVHREGIKHTNADSLSRINHAEAMDQEDDPEYCGSIIKPKFGTKLLRHEQHSDPDLQIVIELVDKQVENPKKYFKDKGLVPSLDMEYYAANLKRLSLKSGLLFFQHRRQHVTPCLPRSLWITAVRAAHEGQNHFGFDKSLFILRRHVYFPGMRMLLLAHIRACLQCQLKQGKPKPQAHTYRPVTTGFPMRRISIDFVGPLPAAKGGYKYLFTVQCLFTKWLEAFPTSKMTAEVAIRLLHKEIICRFGIVETIHSDNAQSFLSKEFQEYCDRLNIVLSQTPAYHPQSNPVERAHRDLGGMLRARTAHKPHDWLTHLPECLFALRTSCSKSTNCSPFELMFGRVPNIPLTAIVGAPPRDPELEHLAPESYAAKMGMRIEEVMRYARKNLQLAIIRQKRYHYHKQPVEYHLKDKVWLWGPLQPTKLKSGWSGPWTINEIINPVVLRLDPHPSWKNLDPLSKPVVVSIDRVKPYINCTKNLLPDSFSDLELPLDFDCQGPFGSLSSVTFPPDGHKPSNNPDTTGMFRGLGRPPSNHHRGNRGRRRGRGRAYCPEDTTNSCREQLATSSTFRQRPGGLQSTNESESNRGNGSPQEDSLCTTTNAYQGWRRRGNNTTGTNCTDFGSSDSSSSSDDSSYDSDDMPPLEQGYQSTTSSSSSGHYAGRHRIAQRQLRRRFSDSHASSSRHSTGNSTRTGHGILRVRNSRTVPDSSSGNDSSGEELFHQPKYASSATSTDYQTGTRALKTQATTPTGTSTPGATIPSRGHPTSTVPSSTVSTTRHSPFTSTGTRSATSVSASSFSSAESSSSVEPKPASTASTLSTTKFRPGSPAPSHTQTIRKRDSQKEQTITEEGSPSRRKRAASETLSDLMQSSGADDWKDIYDQPKKDPKPSAGTALEPPGDTQCDSKSRSYNDSVSVQHYSSKPPGAPRPLVHTSTDGSSNHAESTSSLPTGKGTQSGTGGICSPSAEGFHKQDHEHSHLRGVVDATGVPQQSGFARGSFGLPQGNVEALPKCENITRTQGGAEAQSHGRQHPSGCEESTQHELRSSQGYSSSTDFQTMGGVPRVLSSSGTRENSSTPTGQTTKTSLGPMESMGQSEVEMEDLSEDWNKLSLTFEDDPNDLDYEPPKEQMPTETVYYHTRSRDKPP